MDGRISTEKPVTSSDNSYQQPPSVLSVDGRMDNGNVAEIEEYIMFNLDNSELTQMKKELVSFGLNKYIFKFL